MENTASPKSGVILKETGPWISLNETHLRTSLVKWNTLFVLQVDARG